MASNSSSPTSSDRSNSPVERCRSYWKMIAASTPPAQQVDFADVVLDAPHGKRTSPPLAPQVLLPEVGQRGPEGPEFDRLRQGALSGRCGNARERVDLALLAADKVRPHTVERRVESPRLCFSPCAGRHPGVVGPRRSDCPTGLARGIEQGPMGETHSQRWTPPPSTPRIAVARPSTRRPAQGFLPAPDPAANKRVSRIRFQVACCIQPPSRMWAASWSGTQP